MRIWLPLVVVGGCASQGVVHTVPEAPPLALTVDSPADGAFAGDGPIAVTGHVTDPGATVLVEGVEVEVAADGTFEAEVPLEGAWRIVDVEARRTLSVPTEDDREALVLARGEIEEALSERRAVLAGVDPMTGWTGAISLRLTRSGLDGVGEALALQVDAMDLPNQLIAWVPAFDVLGFGFAPSMGRSQPARVLLEPSEQGIAVEIVLDQLELGFDVSNPLTGDTLVVLGTEEARLGAGMDLGLDTAGALVLGVTDTTVELGRPVLQLGSLDPSLLETLTEPVVDWVAGALEGVLDLGSLLLPELGAEPLAFETDLLGTPLSLALGALGTDDDGLGARLDVDVGVAPTGEARVPTAEEAGDADLAVTLHEGLLQGLLAGDLLAMLDLDLQLDGAIGEVVALPLANLPGGHLLPADRTGFCLSIDPGDVRAARLEGGLSPLGRLILPDVTVDVGVSTPERSCGDWLEASLAIEALLDASDGTTIGFDVEIGEGAVLSYAAEGDHDEAEIIAGLGGLVDTAMVLLGGSLSLDLTELLGGATGELPLPELAPRMLGAQAVEGAPGQVIVTLDLFE